MKAVILCGGKGTRLRPYTHSIPKPMLRLGRKPLLEYIVEYLAREGVTEIVMTVGHLKEQIMDYFKDGAAYGVKISYSVEEDELGTAGSVKNALKKFRQDDDFLVAMGDQLTSLSLKGLMDYHKKHGAALTIALKQTGIPFQYGTAEINDKGEITGFKEKPIIQNLINVGIYALSPKAAGYLPDKGDFALDVFPKMMREKQKLCGFVFDDYWIDVGSLHDYEHVNQIFSLTDLVNRANGR